VGKRRPEQGETKLVWEGGTRSKKLPLWAEDLRIRRGYSQDQEEGKLLSHAVLGKNQGSTKQGRVSIYTGKLLQKRRKKKKKKEERNVESKPTVLSNCRPGYDVEDTKQKREKEG